MLGFEPRSEAPQASRIIHCSEPGGLPRTRSYPTRASEVVDLPGAPRMVRYKRPDPTGERPPDALLPGTPPRGRGKRGGTIDVGP